MDASLFFQVVEMEFGNVPKLRQVCKLWRQWIDSSLYLCKSFTDRFLNQSIRKTMIQVQNNLLMFGQCDIVTHGSRMTLRDLAELIHHKKFDLVYHWMKHNPFKRIRMDELDDEKFHPVVYSLVCDLTDAEFSMHFVPILRHFFEIDESDADKMDQSIRSIVKSCCYEFDWYHHFSKSQWSFDAIERLCEYNLIQIRTDVESYSFLLTLEKIDKLRTLDFIKKNQESFGIDTEEKLASERCLRSNGYSPYQVLVKLACLWVKSKKLESLYQLFHFAPENFNNSIYLRKCIKCGFIDGLQFISGSMRQTIGLGRSFHRSMRKNQDSIKCLIMAKSLIRPESFDRTLFQYGDINLIKAHAHFIDPGDNIENYCHIPFHVHEFLLENHPLIYTNTKFMNQVNQLCVNQSIGIQKRAEIVKCLLDCGPESIVFLKTFEHEHPSLIDFWFNQLTFSIEFNQSVPFEFFVKFFPRLIDHCPTDNFLIDILGKVHDFEDNVVSYLRLLHPHFIKLSSLFNIWIEYNNFFRWETYSRILHFDGIFHIYTIEQLKGLLSQVIKSGNWHHLHEILDPSVIHVQFNLMDVLKTIDTNYQIYDLSLIDVASKISMNRGSS